MDEAARINKRLVNERLSNTANAALKSSEDLAGNILKMASEAQEVLTPLSDTTQMSLAERMLRATRVLYKLAMITTYANAIKGEIAPVWDVRRQVKGNGEKES